MTDHPDPTALRLEGLRLVEAHLPLERRDTPDFAEIIDKNGEKVALTIRPDFILYLNNLPTLLTTLAALTEERDDFLTTADTLYDALTKAEQERDEAVKRAEKAEAEREAARADAKHVCDKSDSFIVQRDEAYARIVDLQDELETAEARAAAMEAALEEISGHAPVKTPPDYATSSDTGEAFDDGYSRGVWEMGQIADAALAPQAEAGEPG